MSATTTRAGLCRFAAILCCAAIGAVGSAEAADAAARFKAAHTGARAAYRSGDARPSTAARLAPTPAAATPETAARAFLAAWADLLDIADPARDLVPGRTFATRWFTTIEFHQRHGGLPVIGAAVKLTLKRSAAAETWSVDRFSQSLVPASKLKGVATTPAVDRGAITATALQSLAVPAPGAARATPDDVRIDLAVDGALPDPRLVWIVHAKHARRIGPYNPHTIVDAETGRTIRTWNAVFFDAAPQGSGHRVNAFQPSPGRAVDWRPLLRQVEILRLEQRSTPTGEPGTLKSLTGDLLHVFNCPDRGANIQVPIGGQSFSAPICTEEQLAEEDTDGNFYYEPDLDAQANSPFSSPAGQDDKFAEASMYYHLDKFYDYMQRLDALIAPEWVAPGGKRFTTLDEKPFRGTVNFKTPNLPFIGGGGSGRFTPFDNAFFAPAGPLIPGVYSRDEDSVVFGQGQNVDFSYDGDVVYHELTHAIIGSTIGLAGPFLDATGAVVSPGAMNEGLADFFAATFVGDPDMAEYAGSRIGRQSGENALRELANTLECPNYLWGEVHNDSRHFSGALWSLRQALNPDANDPEAKRISAAMLAGLLGLTPQPSFDDAGIVFAESLRDALGDAAGTAADAEFARRRITGCVRSIRVPNGSPVGKDVMSLPQSDQIGVTPAPGYFQLNVEVTNAAHDEIVVEALTAAGGGFGGGPTVNVTLYAAKEAPVALTYVRNQTQSSNVVLEGRFERLPTSPVPQSTAWRAVLKALNGDPFPGPGVYHVVFLNNATGGGFLGGGGTQLQNVTLKSRTAEVPEVEEEAETGGDTDAEAPEEDVTPPADDDAIDVPADGDGVISGPDADDAPTDTECSPGARECVNTGFARLCGNDGRWVLVQCPAGQFCSPAAQNACTGGMISGTKKSSGCTAGSVAPLVLLAAAAWAARRGRRRVNAA